MTHEMALIIVGLGFIGWNILCIWWANALINHDVNSLKDKD